MESISDTLCHDNLLCEESALGPDSMMMHGSPPLLRDCRGWHYASELLRKGTVTFYSSFLLFASEGCGTEDENVMSGLSVSWQELALPR